MGYNQHDALEHPSLRGFPLGCSLRQDFNLVRFFREQATERGAKVALKSHTDGRETTWSELGRRMDQVARGLIRLGHQPGEKVGLCGRNMPEWTLADLGILAARGVCVPLYPTSNLDQAAYIVRDAGIRIFIAGEQAQVDLGLALLERARAALPATPAIGVPNTGGRGDIQGGSIESSTVDIAQEFTNLIVLQRGYQANSRVITTADTLSQETINLIH